MPRKVWQKIALLLAGTLVAAGVGAGIASASIPDSSGVIHGCYKVPVPAHGTPLSVIDTNAGGTCPSGTVALTWYKGTGDLTTQGSPGTALAQNVITVQPGSEGFSTAQCLPGMVVTGGGHSFVNFGGTEPIGVTLFQSVPSNPEPGPPNAYT